MTVASCVVCHTPLDTVAGGTFFPYCKEHQPCGCGECSRLRRARIESGECEDCGCLECECDENARRRAEDRLEAAHDDMRAERDRRTT